MLRIATAVPCFQVLIRRLAEAFPLELVPAAQATAVLEQAAEGTPAQAWRRETGKVLVAGSVAAAGRALGHLLAGLEGTGECCAFTSLGLMRDCSRNAVPTVDHLAGWLRRLCLMGYNQAMLYTEDTYQIPAEPAFGYCRGAYAAADLTALDDLAHDLGIELVGCIQTLGHLEQALRWDPLQDLRDTSSVLLVDDAATERLIGRMLDVWATTIRSRRIHIGMDEAYDLGRGRHLDRGGAYEVFTLLNRHLGLVSRLCRERGLQPMIWSDMYLRFSSARHDYYDTDAQVRPEVAARIPDGLQLVYWDYYHADPDFYRRMIALHRQFGREPVMASGIWTWSRFWHDHHLTAANAGACVAACRQSGVNELFFTLWGDDGGYCDMDSALAGLAYGAELAWGGAEDARLARRFTALCGADYRVIAILPAGLDHPVPLCGTLWDDPLLRIFRREWQRRQTGIWDTAVQAWEAAIGQLTPHRDSCTAGEVAGLVDLLSLLVAKVRLLGAVEAAWTAQDRPALQQAAKACTALATQVDGYTNDFRTRWLRSNRPFGLETLQIRLAGQAARWRELAARLDDWLCGRVATIPELDDRPWPELPRLKASWRSLAAGTHIL